MKLLEKDKELVKYLKSLGIKVCTNTKARGNRGFYCKNRIDISKDVPPERFYDTLVHEFAHHIHSNLESDFFKGGSLKVLFNLENIDEIEQELLKVTDFIEPNSRLENLKELKEKFKSEIKEKENIIKMTCPDFQKSKPYKPFEKVIKKSKAKHLLKYDRVRFVTPFLRRVEYFSIDTVEQDFPELKKEFVEILKLKSLQKKQTNNTQRINRYNKYFQSSTELFARFVQGLVYDKETTKTLAPKTCDRFFELLEDGYYKGLNYIFK